MRRGNRTTLFILTGLAGLLIGTGLLLAQDTGSPDTGAACDPAELAQQQQTFADLLTLDFENQPETARANLFRLGAQYQRLAVECGYQPAESEIQALIALTLSLTDVSTILAANAVGDDVQAILAELEPMSGDPLNGQLLYNGIEPGLDGSTLGCAGCHNGQAAPETPGTWTRAAEIRLQDEALAGYSVRQYLVESIVRPNDYIPPGYSENLMPTNYGSRLDLQQMADLIAYLESQDQLLEDEAESP